MTATDSSTASVLRAALDGWQSGIARHDPQAVAGHFTPDAVFQGFDPTHTTGRDAVAAYYAKQPVGLTADYTVLEARQLADAVIVGYARVAFTRPDGTVIDVYLTVILTRVDGEWLISHYHVSKIG